MSAPASPERNQNGVPKGCFRPLKEWGRLVDPPAAYRDVLKPQLASKSDSSACWSKGRADIAGYAGDVVDCGVISMGQLEAFIQLALHRALCKITSCFYPSSCVEVKWTHRKGARNWGK